MSSVLESAHRFKTDDTGNAKPNKKRVRRQTPEQREALLNAADKAVHEAIQLNDEESWNTAVKRLRKCGAFYEKPVFITFLTKCPFPLIRLPVVDVSIDYLQKGIRNWELRGKRSLGRAIFLSHRLIRLASDEKGSPERFNEVDVYLKVYWAKEMPDEVDDHLVRARKQLGSRDYHPPRKRSHSDARKAQKHLPEDEIRRQKGGARKRGKKGH